MSELCTELRTAQDIRREVDAAEARIRPHIRETFLEFSPFFSELSGADVHLKLENLQHCGSFKARGAVNKVLSLDEEQRRRGVVAASTGNHGLAVAYALEVVGASGVVFVPNGAAPTKVTAIERLGVDVRNFGDDCVETERHARTYARENGMCFLSPYNDSQIIGGQGTIALELMRQHRPIDAVLVSLGGGGLLSGIAGYLAAVSPATRVYGCSPENSKVMIESVKAGRILDLPSQPTLSDASAGGVEEGAITFPLCRDLVEDFVTVSEVDIAECLRQFVESHHMLIEGSAASVLASLLACRDELAGKTVVAVICGGNIGIEPLRRVLSA